MARAIKSKKPTGRWTRVRDWFFAPPYYGVPWLIWFYALFAFALYSDFVLTGHLVGFDDQVRMVQVLNWVNGAGWYDRTIMRANGPEGFTTIWTRIADIPLALIISILQIFVVQKKAALLASIISPFLQLAVLFWVARYFVRPLVGKDHARLIALFIMFTTVMNYKEYTFSGFHPGQAGHHSWYIITNLLLFGAAARLVSGVSGWQPIATMGAAIGISLAVGIESFPIIAGVCGIMGLVAWGFRAPYVALRGAQGMAAGALLSLLLLPMHVPFSNFFEVSFAQPSILGPILIATAALFLLIEKYILEFLKNKILTAASVMAVAGVLGVVLVWFFPQMLDGPAAGLSPTERAMAFAEHPEARPMYLAADGMIEVIGLAMPLLIAFVTGIIGLATATGRRQRMLRIMYFGSFVICAVLAQFMWRFYHHAGTTCCSWLLWAWIKIKECLTRTTNYSLKVLACFIMLGPFWMFLLPAMDEDVKFFSNVVMFPAKIHANQETCDMVPIADYINDHYEKNNLLNVPQWESSKALFLTNLRIDFVANFPSQDKFIENNAFFEARNPDEAKIIARKKDIDLVMLCRLPSMINKKLPPDQQMLMGLLQLGYAPDWLKLVDTRLPGNYVLYEVDKTKLKKD